MDERLGAIRDGKVEQIRLRPGAGTVKIFSGCAVAGIIVWFAPFDLAFKVVSLGVAPLRVAIIIGVALAGVAIGRRVGMDVEPRGAPYPILAPLALAAAVAVWCAAIDGLMRAEAGAGYITLMRLTPVAYRIAIFAARAFVENIIYRLFLGSLLVWAIGLLWKRADGRPAAGAYVAGFMFAQVANIWINVTAFAPLTPMHLTHDALPYVAPGLVWGLLYWRRGFQSTEIACTSVHVVLQPLLTLLFE